MKTSMRLMSLLIVTVALTLSGCNTVHGIGRDIEKGGEAIERAAK
jgi:entericidin B